MKRKSSFWMILFCVLACLVSLCAKANGEGGKGELVLVTGNYCVPCKAMKNRLVEAGIKYREVDVNDYPEKTRIPLILYCINGNGSKGVVVKAWRVGLVTVDEVRKMMKE